MNPAPLLVSITTHGARTHIVTRILKPVVESCRRIGASVCLTLHRSDLPNMSDELVEMVRKGEVELLVSAVDYGSNLKYLLAMERHPDRPVMVQDDDVVFPDAVFEEMLAFAQAKPRAIGARRVRAMRWERPAWPGSFSDYPMLDSTTVARPTRTVDSFPEGCKGIVFPAGCFRELLQDPKTLSDIQGPCFHDDDVALRLLAVRADIPTYLVPTRRMLDIDYARWVEQDGKFVPVDQLIKDTSLWFSGNNGERTTNCLRHFAQELWDRGGDL